MPYVEGESLRDRLAREGQLPIADAVRLLEEIADALAYSHAPGVVHRDIKPGNVMLSGKHAIVTDFGVAKALPRSRRQLTTVGIAVGTPQYMAPEQATGEENIDHRADIYALGVLGYEMLDRPPAVRRHGASGARRARDDQPVDVREGRPGIPPLLSETVMQLPRQESRRPLAVRRRSDRTTRVDRRRRPAAASLRRTRGHLQATSARPKTRRSASMAIGSAAVVIAGRRCRRRCVDAVARRRRREDRQNRRHADSRTSRAKTRSSFPQCRMRSRMR